MGYGQLQQRHDDCLVIELIHSARSLTTLSACVRLVFTPLPCLYSECVGRDGVLVCLVDGGTRGKEDMGKDKEKI